MEFYGNNEVDDESYDPYASESDFDFVYDEMHLSVTAKRRTRAYCSTNEAIDFRTNIECFPYKLPFCLRDKKIPSSKG